MIDTDRLLQLVADPHGLAEINQLFATAEQRNTRAYLEGAPGWERQAEEVGMITGAHLLCTAPELLSGTLLPSQPRKPGERITPMQTFSRWIAARALTWDDGDLDVLDADLGNQAMSETNRVEAVRLYRCRGVLAFVRAWRTGAPVDADRHHVPVSSDAPNVLHVSPPCGAYTKPRPSPLAQLRAGVEALLDRAHLDGMSCGASPGDALRAADMAAGRMQALREVLAMLPRPMAVASAMNQEPMDRFNALLALATESAPPMLAITFTGDDDCDGLGETCEGCDSPAVTRDSQGVPLCQLCYDDLPLVEETGGEDTDGGFAPYRREDGHAL